MVSICHQTVLSGYHCGYSLVSFVLFRWLDDFILLDVIFCSTSESESSMCVGCLLYKSLDDRSCLFLNIWKNNFVLVKWIDILCETRKQLYCSYTNWPSLTTNFWPGLNSNSIPEYVLSHRKILDTPLIMHLSKLPKL